MLIIDDADTFGPAVAELAEDVTTVMPGTLLVLGMRSTRADRVMGHWQVDGKLRREVTVPLLEDSDIDRLLRTLRNQQSTRKVEEP